MQKNGPTDDAIRDFKDSYDEVKRYKKIHKKNRQKAKEKLAKIKKMNPEDIEE